jgi:hypothetical protein
MHPDESDPAHLDPATLVEIDAYIRRSIGGDRHACAWVVARASMIEHPALITMAALIERDRDVLERASAVAVTNRERQVVAIARAHLMGLAERVDALARDHLADHPDSLIVAWIAATDCTSSDTGPLG